MGYQLGGAPFAPDASANAAAAARGSFALRHVAAAFAYPGGGA